MNDTDKYIIGSAQTGRDVKVIAAKLGMTVEAVEQRLRDLQATSDAQKQNGSHDLLNAFNNTCQQYQMVGEGLKHLGANLSDPVTVTELAALIGEPGGMTNEAIAQRILARFILLRPYTPTEVESLEENYLKEKAGN